MAYSPRAWSATPLPPQATLHGLRRFSAGYTPALRAQVQAAGGFGVWFERQLGTSYDDTWYSTTSSWWTSINASPGTIWQRDRSGVEPMWRADANYEAWALVRRLGSQRQVLETMAEFWEHHFHVPAHGDVGPYRTAYGKLIRRHALGRFDALLPAAVLDPAMAIYLNNANSSKTAPNENLGRELLELHTVGRGAYTETDVKNSARILTGYRVAEWDTWAHTYSPAHHWTGPVKVMGFSHANADPDGRPVVAAYLRYLAHHPKTAVRIARKLAQRFVADSPPEALVTRLAQVYLANGTAIQPVLRSLVGSEEFKASWGQKVRTPSEDVVATWRALDIRPSKPSTPDTTSDHSGANVILWQSHAIGSRPFAWQPPDGRPDRASAWSSASRFLNSLDVHWSLSGGWWPSKSGGTTYRTPASWLPAPQIRFDELVDHLARTLHGLPSTALLLQVACEATGRLPGDVITSSHSLVVWDMARLLTVFLDSPTHMSR